MEVAPLVERRVGGDEEDAGGVHAAKEVKVVAVKQRPVGDYYRVIYRRAAWYA